MKRVVSFLVAAMLLFALAACNNIPPETGAVDPVQAARDSGEQTESSSVPADAISLQDTATDNDEGLNGQGAAMQIRVQAGGNTTVFELNDSRAAGALYAQLPLTIEVEDYSSNEKIFYPPQKLDTADTPLVEEGAPLGTLAYYAPWGDVVMFYDSFGPGLYELGCAISGVEHIAAMSGVIQIEAIPGDGKIQEAEPDKTLLVYFSHTGATADVANVITQAVDVDTFEIVPLEPYPTDYNTHLAIARQEQEEDARPHIQWEPLDLSRYDTILVGYPIWHGTIPMPVATFLESRDFSGKRIAPFSTSGSTSISRSEAHIAELVPDAELVTGLGITGSTLVDAGELVSEWIAALGL